MAAIVAASADGMVVAVADGMAVVGIAKKPRRWLSERPAYCVLTVGWVERF